GHRRVLQAIHSSRRVEGGRFQVLIPEVDAAVRVSRRIGSDFIESEFPMADGYGIMEVNCPGSLAGKTLRELNLRQKFHITVVGHHLPSEEIGPGNRMELASPDEHLPKGSLLTILGKDEDLQHFVRKFES
ncbi:MAG: TrkA C-terminal domain-containing protein, partial [Planctomycetota bacterium]